jgi:NhaP-type Na+/H+ or K+/H+ antiporter
MVYTTVGLVVGGAGLGWFDLLADGEALSIVVEATLVLVLFTDAARMNVTALRHDVAVPGRLLGIGLPLTVLAGTLCAAFLWPQMSWAGALLLAAVLAPTDAALGQAVVTDRRLPVRVRQSLNVESGLNDGLMVPIVTVAIALAASEDNPGASASDWGVFAAQQILVGISCGVLVGLIGGRLLGRASASGRIEGVNRQLATLSVAAGAYAVAELLGGNGFVAAFLAGMVFGVAQGSEVEDASDFTEDEGDLLTAVTFVVFGAVLIPPALSSLTWSVAGYVVLSLTVVRMVPVSLALTGSGLLLRTRLFLGWFGPRGLASILFALLVAQEVDGPEAALIVDVATWTVLLSVYVHGASATPWAGWLAARLASVEQGHAEKAPSIVRPTRRSLG